MQDSLGGAPDEQAHPTSRGDLVFRDVTFNSPGRSRPLLDRINLHVQPGQTLAIVGPDDVGKTTLMSLLMRLLDPTSGSIELDGHNLCDQPQEWLRRNLAVVLPEPLLFNDTIRENIAYGKPEATFDEIVAAAKAANAHEMIVTLPEGYDSICGVRGGTLSSSERQRVTIARALVKNPPLIVLDEAASTLDAEGEALIQGALRRLLGGRTAFVIAHRLSTVMQADHVVLLRDGRVSEQGTHEALMRQSGYYANLVHGGMRGPLGN